MYVRVTPYVRTATDYLSVLSMRTNYPNRREKYLKPQPIKLLRNSSIFPDWRQRPARLKRLVVPEVTVAAHKIRRTAAHDYQWNKIIIILNNKNLRLRKINENWARNFWEKRSPTEIKVYNNIISASLITSN